MPRVKSKDLAEFITYELDKWSTEISHEVKEFTKLTAYQGCQQLKNVDMSGISDGRSWLKEYSKNWLVADRSADNYANYVIHNGNKKKPTYRLTHLLEHGHATRNGGRTREFKHIAPVRDRLVVEYQQGIKRILKGGK